jgi:hypothetical protein
MQIEGPPRFTEAVTRLLQALRTNSPQRYQEVLCAFPSVRYDPETLRRDHPDGAVARADGLFGIDGSDFGYFAWIFLHEVGHQIAREQGLGNGEWPANTYADAVILELAL